MQHQRMHPAYRLEPGWNVQVVTEKYQKQEENVQEEDGVDNKRPERLHANRYPVFSIRYSVLRFIKLFDCLFYNCSLTRIFFVYEEDFFETLESRNTGHKEHEKDTKNTTKRPVIVFFVSFVSPSCPSCSAFAKSI